MLGDMLNMLNIPQYEHTIIRTYQNQTQGTVRAADTVDPQERGWRSRHLSCLRLFAVGRPLGRGGGIRGRCSGSCDAT